MHVWLVVSTTGIAMAAADLVAGLCAARKRTLPRRVVPGPRDIVAELSDVVFC
jgi:hypothetical protein